MDGEKCLFASNLSPALVDQPDDLLEFMSQVLRHLLPKTLRSKPVKAEDYVVAYATRPNLMIGGKATCVLHFNQPSIVAYIMTLAENKHPVPPLELCANPAGLNFKIHNVRGGPSATWACTPALYLEVCASGKICLMDSQGLHCPSGNACEYEHAVEGRDPSLRYLFHRIVYSLARRGGYPGDPANVCMIYLIGGKCFTHSCKFVHDTDLALQLRRDYIRATLGRQSYDPSMTQWIKQVSQELAPASPRQSSAINQAIDAAYERRGLQPPPAPVAAPAPARGGGPSGVRRDPSPPAVAAPVRDSVGGSGSGSSASPTSVRRDPSPPAPIAAVSSKDSGSGCGASSASSRRNRSPPAIAAPVCDSGCCGDSSPRASKNPVPPSPPSGSASRDCSSSPVCEMRAPVGFCMSGLAGELFAMATHVEEEELRHRHEVESLRAEVTELQDKLRPLANISVALSKQGLDKIGLQSLHALMRQLQSASASVLQEISDRTTCRICFDGTPEVMFQCGHGVCHKDAENFKEGVSKCPICNATILEKKRNYMLS